MKYIKITAVIVSGNLALAEELISDIFFSHDVKGVVCRLPLETHDGIDGTHETLPEENAVEGYVPDVTASQALVRQIRQKISGLPDSGIQARVRTKTVDEADWADAWKQYFDVTRITERMVIKPAWKSFEPSPRDIVIHLDPGMAFGTGTHPTTAACLAQIEKHLKPGDTFLDVGCGSGILMIGAAGLGASRLCGIDTDEIAVQVTRDNLDKNHIRPQQFQLHHGTLAQCAPPVHDLVAANILAQVLADIMADIRRCMGPRSLAVLSGIIREHQQAVLGAMERNGLFVKEKTRVEEWVTLTAGVIPGHILGS